MSYHKGKNNADVGGIKPKSGMHYTPLCRKAGMAQCMDVVGSRTRSRYKGSGKHNHYEGASGYGDNENILGYNPE